jgi:spore germination protein
MKLLFKIIVCLFIILGGMWLYFSVTYPLTSPFKSTLYLLEHFIQPQKQYKNYVLGFLPYWRLDQINYLRPNALSELNFFSLSVNSDGHLLTVTNGQADPGWNGWSKQTTKDFITKSQIMGAKISVTIAAQDNQLIENILNSNTAQQNLISDILTQIKERKLNGINIDFEYSGVPDTVLQQEFTFFSKKLATQLKQQNPNTQLSLSIMPLSARNQDLYDFSQLVPLYNHFIGMSYDYYGQASDIAGPVAPMNGFKEGTYFFDVTTTYADYLKYIPKNKLVLGVPTYGWEWAVLNGKAIKSPTLAADNPNSYAAVISYARAREDNDLKPSQCQWDTLAKETWCWFTDKKSGIDHQVWLADNRMLQTRFDYADNQNFAGVALWTLGLDKNYPDIWDRLGTTFGK